MSRPFRVAVNQATLAQRFMLASLIILIVGMAGMAFGSERDQERGDPAQAQPPVWTVL
jgi:hypothetical protein